MTHVVTLARRPPQAERGRGEGSRGLGGGNTLRSAVDQATRRLTGTLTETPRLDAEVLMCFVLGWTRARLFAHWDASVSAEQIDRYVGLVERRASGEPVAYLRNLKEFMGLEFYVDPRVLIPRPETELLVTRAVAWLENEKLRNEPNSTLVDDEKLRNEPNSMRAAWLGGEPRTQNPEPRTVVDVGTGSGAVAISIAKHVPEVRVIATDVTGDALDVARQNSGNLFPLPRRGRRPVRGGNTPIDFRRGSLLEPVDGPVDLIVANLPYLSRDEYEGLLDTSIAYEPRVALTDDADGLQLFAELFNQIPAKLAREGCVLLEIGSGQPAKLQRLACERLPDFEASVFADYAGLPRVLQFVPSRSWVPTFDSEGS